MDIFLSPPGVLCCAGSDRESFFEAACRGDQGGIRPVTASGGRAFLAGRIQGTLPEAPALPGLAAPPEFAANTRIFRIAAAALEELRPSIEKARNLYGAGRVGVCLGSCDNGTEASVPAHQAFFAGKGFPANYELRFQGASLLADYIAGISGVTGPALTVATACASGAGALVKGAEFIRAGFCDAVIAGGADIVSDTVLLGFSSLEAVSDTITNPFSKNRKGITLGEGAAFFVLSKDDPGDAGGIALLGAGESADAFHMTAPREDGSGAVQAMRAALQDAGIGPGDIDYINLHGTGTPLNDRMEALAVQTVFGEEQPPASSSKPVTGHTLGAAGALEPALCWMALAKAAARKDGKAAIPAHCWDGEYDDAMPRLRLGERYFPAGFPPRVCMSNSFAFGGCNVCLVVGKR
ncbi:MAG: 3-oxoacyl-ACP synthase [Spirochaetaceae bacterium]|jgi:3-oxoacyl-[acyl-carrier-protein] synthase-1|nr:3-oxoacyl-ACP synthase [Spirochaetaceae bacterium]